MEFRGDLWRQKTRVPGLSCGLVCVILIVEHRLVTDTDKDGRTQAHGWYRGCIASRGKNRTEQIMLQFLMNSGTLLFFIFTYDKMKKQVFYLCVS